MKEAVIFDGRNIYDKQELQENGFSYTCIGKQKLIRKVLILANNDIGLYSFRLEIIERLQSEGIKNYLSLVNGKRITDFEVKGYRFLQPRQVEEE